MIKVLVQRVCLMTRVRFSEKSSIFPCGFKYGGKLRCFTEIPFSDNPFTPAHAQRRKSRLRFFMSLPNFSKVLEGPLRQLHNISEPLQDGLEKMLNLTIIYSILPNVSFWTSSHPWRPQKTKGFIFVSDCRFYKAKLSN